MYTYRSILVCRRYNLYFQILLSVFSFRGSHRWYPGWYGNETWKKESSPLHGIALYRGVACYWIINQRQYAINNIVLRRHADLLHNHDYPGNTRQYHYSNHYFHDYENNICNNVIGKHN